MRAVKNAADFVLKEQVPSIFRHTHDSHIRCICAY